VPSEKTLPTPSKWMLAIYSSSPPLRARAM